MAGRTAGRTGEADLKRNRWRVMAEAVRIDPLLPHAHHVVSSMLDMLLEV